MSSRNKSTAWGLSPRLRSTLLLSNLVFLLESMNALSPYELYDRRFSQSISGGALPFQSAPPCDPVARKSGGRPGPECWRPSTRGTFSLASSTDGRGGRVVVGDVTVSFPVGMVGKVMCP